MRLAGHPLLPPAFLSRARPSAPPCTSIPVAEKTQVKPRLEVSVAEGSPFLQGQCAPLSCPG